MSDPVEKKDKKKGDKKKGDKKDGDAEKDKKKGDKKKDKDGAGVEKPDDGDDKAAPKEDPAEADNLVLEEIDIEEIQKLPDVLKEQFQQVMADVRKSLEESLLKVEKDVNSQLAKVDIVKSQIVSNHETMARWNHAKKKKYDHQRTDLLKEKDDWEKDKKAMEKVSNPIGETVNLNIGGLKGITSSIEVLTSDVGSNLEKLFKGDHKQKMIDNEVFLDRDGDTFKTLLNYLRNGQDLLPEFDSKNQEIMFLKELQFWKIGEQFREKLDKKGEKLKPEPLDEDAMYDDYVSPYAPKNMGRNRGNSTMENRYDSNVNGGQIPSGYYNERRQTNQVSRHDQIDSDNRLYNSNRNQRGSVYSTPNISGFGTPKAQRSLNPSNSRKSVNRMSSATSRFGKKSNQKKTLNEKKEDLEHLMRDEPKKRSSTGYAISDDLRVKWKQLGPFTIDDIEKHIHEWAEEADADNAQIDYSGLDIGQSKSQPQIIGQIDKKGQCQGVGKKTSPYSLYEGQFKNDKRHGFGRVIYSSFYYIGQWQNDRQHGYGKQVDVQGNVQEGIWNRNNFIGDAEDDDEE